MIMKVLILFATVLTVASAINPAAIYRSRCSEGASYWCKSATHADECGAVEYCIQNFWRGKLVQESAACQDCEAFVNAAKNVLKQTTVQDEILDGIKQACVVMDSLSDLCQTLVETVGAEVLQKLVTELTADEVCEVIQFCQEKTALKTTVNEDEVCTLCKDVMSEANALIANVALQQDVENTLLQFCPLVASILPNCAQLVQDEFPMVVQFLLAYLNPDSCTELGICSGNEELRNVFVQLMKLKKREGSDLCTMCKNTMSTVDGMLNNAAIQTAVRLELDQLCYTLGTFAPVCVFAVNKYTGQIISAIANYMSPDTFCPEFRFCPSDENVNVGADMCADCKAFFGDIDGLLTNQTVQNMIIADIDEICDQLGDFADQCKSYVDQYGYIVFDFLASNLSPQTICTDIHYCSAAPEKRIQKLTLTADMCTDCKAFFTDINNLLMNQTVEGMITADIDTLCDKFPTYAAECKMYVKQYAPLVFSLIASELDPEQICTTIQFCPAEMALKVKEPEIDLCSACEATISAVETYVASQANQDFIIQQLDDLICAQTGFFKAQCKSLVKTYTPQIINMILSYMDPKTLCTAVKLCPGTSTLKIIADPTFCADCKAFITDVDSLVSNVTIQTEILTQLEGLCSLAGTALEPECKLLIQTYGPTLFALILSELDPTTDCTELGLCPGTVAPRISVSDPQLCSDCKNFLTDIDSILSNQTLEDAIIADIEGMCSMLGSLEAECKLLVQTYGTAFFSYILSELDPTTFCTEIGVCPGNSAPVNSPRQLISLLPAVQPMSSLNAARPITHKKPAQVTDAGCELCQTIVGLFIPYLESNKTVEEILDAVSELCDVLPASTEQECKNMVSTYGYLIIELLENELSPQAICQEIGECSSATKLMDTKPAKHLKQLLSKLPTDDTFCTLCEIGVAELETILSSNKSKEEIKQEVEKFLCGNLPSPINTQCISFMQIYGDVLVQLLIEQLEPTTFCAEIGLCSSTNKQVLKPKMSSVKLNPECAICEYMVSQLEDLLEENSTEAEIRAALDKVCSYLPSTVVSECDSLINTYTEEFVKYLLLEFSPKAMCAALGICDGGFKMSPVKLNPECPVCEYMVSELEGLITENSTEAEIRHALEEVCSLLPSTLTSECDSLIETYTEDIVKYLLLKYNPKALCTAIGACGSGNKVAISKNVEITTQCILCEYAMEELDKLIENNSTEEEIKVALEDVCNHLSSTLRTECDEFIKQYYDVLLSFLIQELDPKKFCVTIGECAPPAKLMIKDPSAECAICEYAMSELDGMLSENATQTEIQTALDELCSHLPETLTAECTNFVNTYEPILIKLLVSESPQEICTLLALCQSMSLKSLFGTIECDLCQTTVREFMLAIQEPAVSKEIVAIVNETCGILPADLSAECYSYVDQYGDLVTQFIAQFFDPITSCTLLEACPYPDNSPIPHKRLLGQHECTRGPGYWCASMENAKHCNMVEHCKRHAWN